MSKPSFASNLSVDQRQEFEALLAENTNAEMDVLRATTRRHDAYHALLNFVSAHAAAEVQRGFLIGQHFAEAEAVRLSPSST